MFPELFAVIKSEEELGGYIGAANMSASKLASLRVCMQNGKYCSEKLTVYIIPTDDAHQVNHDRK